LAKVKAEGEPASRKLAEHEAKIAEEKKAIAYWAEMVGKAKSPADKEKATKQARRPARHARLFQQRSRQGPSSR
jgi:hypothetical protein